MALDEPLIPARRPAAQHAYRVQLVHHLGHSHQGRHGPERLAAEISIRSSEDDSPSAARQ